MASEKRSALTVIYSAKALGQLDEIWDWNQASYGVQHADAYIEFLPRQISDLAVNHKRGKIIRACPKWQYVLLRRKSARHGHVVVYSVDQTQLNVLFVFHSAQDWQNHMMQ